MNRLSALSVFPIVLALLLLRKSQGVTSMPVPILQRELGTACVTFSGDLTNAEAVSNTLLSIIPPSVSARWDQDSQQNPADYIRLQLWTFATERNEPEVVVPIHLLFSTMNIRPPFEETLSPISFDERLDLYDTSQVVPTILAIPIDENGELSQFDDTAYFLNQEGRIYIEADSINNRWGGEYRAIFDFTVTTNDDRSVHAEGELAVLLPGLNRETPEATATAQPPFRVEACDHDIIVPEVP